MLADDEVTRIQALADDVFRNGSECGSTAEQLARDIDPVLAELRELRALLSTPMPCGWDEPYVTSLLGDEPMVSSEWLGDEISLDDAKGLGAALIRAALAARKGK